MLHSTMSCATHKLICFRCLTSFSVFLVQLTKKMTAKDIKRQDVIHGMTQVLLLNLCRNTYRNIASQPVL